MTFTTTELSPFREAICWHGVRAAENKGPSRYCGLPAHLCIVYRPEDGHRGKSPVVIMFLCQDHRDKMLKRGYVTKVIDPQDILKYKNISNVVTPDSVGI